MFEVGEKVVYPHHGAGTVVEKEMRTVLGQKREYLTIRILHNDMTVQVPSENAERVGLRPVIEEAEIDSVIVALTAGKTEMPKNWNRRFKHNRDKMRTARPSPLSPDSSARARRRQKAGISAWSMTANSRRNWARRLPR